MVTRNLGLNPNQSGASMNAGGIRNVTTHSILMSALAVLAVVVGWGGFAYSLG
jgi:hypothetical protein